MNKRERIEKTIAGEPVDRLPVGLWRHFPGDDQRAADLAQSIVDYQNTYDWDFIRVMPSANYMVTGYGTQDIWKGAADGTRDISKYIVQRSLDWTEVRTQDALRGDMGKQLESLRLLGNGFPDGKVPVILTVYSPLAQAERLSGRELLLQNLRTHPDRLRTGLNILTESTLRLIEALRRIPVDGIWYVVEHASYHLMTEKEYQEFGGVFDYKILESMPHSWWLNIVEVQGRSPMLHLFGNYRVQGLCWEDRESSVDLSEGMGYFKGAICGGLGRGELQQGTPTTIQAAVRDAVNQTDGGRRLLLTTGGVMPVTTPMSHLRAARHAVQMVVR